jgi:DNA helicase HerA-like ATPase
LSVISTKFLGDALNADFFVTQLLMELMRHISKNPADRLQGAVVFDEADLYLPAVRKPASKGPMEDLLKRGRSGGLSVFLATQSPGDLDYRCKENVLSWYLGDISQDTALNKIKAMLPAKIKDLTQRLPGQAAGRFHLLKGSQATRIRSLRSAIELKQLPEDRILALAAGVPE